MATLAEILRQTGYFQDGTLAAPAPIEPTMTSILQKHIASIPQKFNENQAAQMDLLARAYPGNTFKSMMTEGDNKALAELAMQVPFNALTAFHGTPHKIVGKFDISKMGTGEGAQAYGPGMYFAENPAVAKEYQKMLRGPESTAQHYLDLYKTPESAISAIQYEIKPNLTAEAKKHSLDAIEVLKSGKELKGNLYKVDIPDEYIPNMLDWDKPLAKQTPEVQAILKDRFPSAFDDPRQATGQALFKEQTKKMGLSGQQKPEQFIADYLNEYGIKGIRYLDEGSRGTGKGTSNFVVFEPSTVKILEENGKPLTRKELIEKQLNALEDTGRAKAGGQVADVNGYFYKGGQFLPTTTAEPGKWKVNGKWVKSGRELIEPGVIANAPTPFSRSILSPLREYVDYVDNDFKKLKLKEGRKVLETVDGMQTYVPVTNETTWTPRLADYEHHTPVTIGELIDAYNKGQRWFDVKPDAVTITTK
jgi:hypothetical protein